MKALLLSIYRVLGSLSNAFFYIILFCGTNTILTERKFGTDKFAQGYRAELRFEVWTLRGGNTDSEQFLTEFQTTQPFWMLNFRKNKREGFVQIATAKNVLPVG